MLHTATRCGEMKKSVVNWLRKSRAVFGALTRSWLLGLLAWCATSPAAYAVDWFVSNRDDICTAMQSAQPGDTLVMRNGTWADEDITFEGRGTVDRPITLRAETPGRVVLTGSSRLRIGGSHLIVDGLYFKDGTLNQFGTNQAVVEFRTIRRAGDPCRLNNWVADHSRLTNSAIENYNPPRITDQYKWVALYGTHNRVDHCTFKHKTNVGVLMVVVRNAVTGEAQRHMIDHNYFLDRPPLSGNAGQILQIGSSADSMSDSLTRVELNLFEHCDGGREIISSKSGKNVFRSNTFVDSQGTLSLRHGNGSVVDGNFFFGNNTPGTGGVRIIGEDHVVFNNYFTGIVGSADTFRAAVDVFDGIERPELLDYFQVKNAVIAFNTFVDNERNIILGGGRDHHLATYCPDPADESCRMPLPPLNTTIANNVVLKVTLPQTQCLINAVDEPINTFYEGNMMFWPEACLGIAPIAGIRETDPRLVFNLLGDMLYRPDVDSPLIGGAVGNYPLVTKDMDGQPRGVSSKDVGADEVSDARITRRPLTARDVGPGWVLIP